MKRLNSSMLTLVIVTSAMFFTTCNDKQKDKLLVTPDKLEFTADDTGKQIVEVDAGDNSWKASASASWIIIDKGTGSFSVSVEEYTETKRDRTGTIIVKSSKTGLAIGDKNAVQTFADSVTITVKQTAAELKILSVDPASIIFAIDETGTKIATVNTNAKSWDATTSAEWLTLGRQENTLKVTPKTLNNGSSPRTANITVTAGNAEPVIVTVTQIITNMLSVKPETVTFGTGETGVKNIYVTTNIVDWNATISAEWLTLEKQGNTLKVTPKTLNEGPLPRTAEVIITAGDEEPVTVTVIQEVTNSLSVDKTSITFATGETGAKIVTVTTSAVSWNASSPVEWLTLEKQENTLKVAPKTLNNGSSPRTTDIIVTATNAKPITITVTQAVTVPNTLSVSPGTLSFAVDQTDTKTATVTTNAASWEAASPVEWLILEKQGNTLRITPTGLNRGSSSRTASVSVTAGTAKSVTLTVTQLVTTMSFKDIVNSTYTATGSPLPSAFAPEPAKGTWTGTLSVSDDPNRYYTINNWAGISDDFYVRLNYTSSGLIAIDASTKVNEIDDCEIYFRVCYITGSNMVMMLSSYSYNVSYNQTAKTLDFSGTVNGYTAYVGLFGKLKTTGEWISIGNTILRNLKLVLTPKAARALQSVGTPTTPAKQSIKVDESELVKIPLKNIKILEGKSLR